MQTTEDDKKLEESIGWALKKLSHCANVAEWVSIWIGRQCTARRRGTQSLSVQHKCLSCHHGMLFMHVTDTSSLCCSAWHESGFGSTSMSVPCKRCINLLESENSVMTRILPQFAEAGWELALMPQGEKWKSALSSTHWDVTLWHRTSWFKMNKSFETC